MSWLWWLGSCGSSAPPLAREEIPVVVDGQSERWQLVWRAPPTLECYGVDALTCPCLGFAVGERGPLDLVRLRTGQPPEVIPLEGLFPDGAATLRRWDALPGDEQVAPPDRPAVLANRTRTFAMVLKDYDHDGRAVEFQLPVTSVACHPESVVVGVRRDGTLGPFTAAGSTEPVVLEPPTWAALAAKGEVDQVEVTCGDHGSDQEQRVQVRADADGLRVERTSRACP